MELTRRNLVPSRTAARRAIADGLVVVAGIPEPKPATMVDANVVLRLRDGATRFVSRGGAKLDGALGVFSIDVSGRSAVDVGASTGGFTDCLLQRGVAGVVAVDVGYGQLAWTLRTDARVTTMERTNIRTADPAEVGAPFDVVVADLSFIGLRLVARQLADLGAAGTDWVVLVKPQFEAGREAVESGGVVTDPAARADAVTSVADAFQANGLGTAGLVPAAVVGAKSGNQEFLLWLRADAPEPDHAKLREIVIST